MRVVGDDVLAVVHLEGEVAAGAETSHGSVPDESDRRARAAVVSTGMRCARGPCTNRLEAR